MNETVKHIRGATCPLICETACLASVGTQLTEAETALISRRGRSEDFTLESSLGHASLGGLVVHSLGLLNPWEGGYFASLKCALMGVGNNLLLSVNVFWTMKFHPERKKGRRANEEGKTCKWLQMQTTVLGEDQKSCSLPLLLCLCRELCLN